WRRVRSDGERRTSTCGAEVMPNLSGPERVRPQVGGRRVEAKLVARHEPEEGAALAADRAVALDDLPDVALHLEGDSPAMASTLVRHFATPDTTVRSEPWRGPMQLCAT